MGALADITARTAFPGRVRQFAASDPGHALGLAIGSAWLEMPRGGHAAAIVPPAHRNHPLVLAGLRLAARLGLPNLSLLGAIDPDLPCEPMGARERQPVHLASLARDLRPRWGACAPRAALDDSAAREPLLLLPARDPRWGCDQAALLALAWIAGDGRRVAWELPAGTPLSAWSAELALIGRMQLPIKLLINRGDLPWTALDAPLARWWVAVAGAADAAGALCWALSGEEVAMLAMPEAMPPGEPWLPGSARRVGDGPAGTWVCIAGREPAHAPPGCGLLVLSGLNPLPLQQLTRSPTPLITDDEDLARHLASLDPRLRCTLAPPSRPAHWPR